MGFFANFQRHDIDLDLSGLMEGLRMRQRAKETAANQEIVRAQVDSARRSSANQTIRTYAGLGYIPVATDPDFKPDPYGRNLYDFQPADTRKDWVRQAIRGMGYEKDEIESLPPGAIMMGPRLYVQKPEYYRANLADIQRTKALADAALRPPTPRTTTSDPPELRQILGDIDKALTLWQKGTQTKETQKFDPTSGLFAGEKVSGAATTEEKERAKGILMGAIRDAIDKGYGERVPWYQFRGVFTPKERTELDDYFQAKMQEMAAPPTEPSAATQPGPLAPTFERYGLDGTTDLLNRYFEATK